MAAVLEANKLITEWLADSPSAEITTIEKSVDGRVTIEEISGALREYANLFKAGYSSPAQTLTLHRAYPDNPLYAETVKEQALFEKDPSVVGGPASVEMIDREGHLITTNALSKAFDKYMKNPMTRNVMVMHSDIQVGWALPAYISKSGQIYKSGIGDNTLFFITELRDDTKISKRVIEEIKKSRMKSYSIAGSAIRTENVSGNMFKGEPPYMRVDELELAEVTICERGVNQGAGFDLIKSNRPTKSCADESCFISKDEGHSHEQETKTMSFDEYKNLVTSRDGKSFTKMFSEYTYVYKGRGPLDRLTRGRAKIEFNTQSPWNPEGNPKLSNPKNVVELQLQPKKKGIKKAILSLLLNKEDKPKLSNPKPAYTGEEEEQYADAPKSEAYEAWVRAQEAAGRPEPGQRSKASPSDKEETPPQLSFGRPEPGQHTPTVGEGKGYTGHKLVAWNNFRGSQKKAGNTLAEAKKNFETSYRADRSNTPKSSTASGSGGRASIKPAGNNIPAKQVRGKMLERYMGGVHSPEHMQSWMKQYGIDPNNIAHHGHMKLTAEQHSDAKTRFDARQARRQANRPPKYKPKDGGETKKAMKTDMLHTLLRIEKIQIDRPTGWKRGKAPLISTTSSPLDRPQAGRTETTSRGVRQTEGIRPSGRKAAVRGTQGRQRRPDTHKNIDRSTIRRS
jgi:hypothetical protein